MKREFFLQDDRSNKFWTIEVVGNEYVTTHGRVGATPRETRKKFASEDAATREADKQVAAKLKKGYVEGEPPAYEKPDWASMPMNDETFWRLIELMNWKSDDVDRIVAPTVKALAAMPVANIEQFEELLAEKLYALDTEQNARHMGEYSYDPEDERAYFSVDLFLYVRCCVVVNGIESFKAALADPTDFPNEGQEFEPLLYVAAQAYELKTGDDDWDYDTKVSWETYSNLEGWNGIPAE